MELKDFMQTHAWSCRRKMDPLLWLWIAAFLGMSQGCPEPCSCVDKYAHQFADCAYKDLQAVPVGLPSNVTTLSLSANKITSLQKSSFVEVTQVTSLWLAHNEISAIEEGTFAILVQLKNLDISYNQIIDFPWGDLYNLSALQLLKMNNNHMVKLPWEAFHTLKDLRSLRINNNKFTTIAEGTFDSLTSLSHLQIYNNPFNCTCRLLWLKSWAENTLISIPERDSISCAAPDSLRGVPLGRIPDLQCAPPSVQLTYHPNLDNTELYDGFTLLLHCSVRGSPQPEVSWKVQTASQNLEIKGPSVERAGNELPSDSSKQGAGRFLVYGNGTLVIPHLSKREEGTYTCLATNELGSNQTSVNVAVAGAQKYPAHPMEDPLAGKAQPGERKPGPKGSKNSVLSPDERPKPLSPTRHSSHSPGLEQVPAKRPPFEKNCGSSADTQYVSNHAFNQSGQLKQHTFDLGVIALDVSEKEAKVQLTPFYGQPEKAHLRALYLCAESGQGHSMVQWSRIEEGVNSYWFQGLTPGTNYSVCLTYLGEDCQVQVVFTTKKEIPSLIIIVVVSIFLLALATVPLLGATCCHLLAKYQGKTYKLIMKAQNPDQMEKHIAADFDPRASYVESEKNYNPSEAEDGEEEREAEGERDESLVAESIAESQSKANPEEFEVGSEYSDRLPLGAEAVNIAQEINGNYRQPAR
ncbi:immunoglobulin superfamily containing leucine-rich repeat protein 2 isoform X1 [Mauremys reevesii]|uniref:immunoglobulin superfamily containing leucine-rich repeat protein 2 isoform X1 n=2 Tax=Mauremys reevesii TaxID=260615 RepID=UPI00193F7215|nr:immunoglobulin superfamily containing leucine-rich repeat protein 2 isoform X1 [Mauremys reevesii]